MYALFRLALGRSLWAAAAASAALSGQAFAQARPAGPDVAPSLDVAAITRRATEIDSSGSYQREVQACLSGSSHQDRQTCLMEARNAQAAERRGQLALQGENYTANALERCRPLLGEDRLACQARVMGFGASSGSVAGGGVLRWVETVMVPAGQEANFVAQTPDPLVFHVPPRY